MIRDKKKTGTVQSKHTTARGRAKAKNIRLAFWMVAFLAMVAAFVLGFVLRGNPSVVSAMGLSSLKSETAATTSLTASQKAYSSLTERVDEVDQLLAANSFDDIQLEDTTNSILSTLIKATDDPYAQYFTKERYAEYLKDSTGFNFSGIGVLFGDYEGRAYASDVLEGSQAQGEGVKQGDYVVSIDGDSSHAWSASEVISALAQHKNEDVIITWMRTLSLDATAGEEFTTTLECKEYDVKNVSCGIREDNIGYIKLRQITGNCAELVKNAIEKLSKRGAKAYVLDISDNPGGYLTQALDTASLFVTSGVLVGIETVEGENTRSASGTTETELPLVVLVNKYTAGSAEVLAAALKDNSRATVVGQTTTGKGSVQVTRELSFGGAVRYTAAYYLTPLGQQINGVGVVPNIEVPSSAKRSSALEVAINTAKSLIGQ